MIWIKRYLKKRRQKLARATRARDARLRLEMRPLRRTFDYRTPSARADSQYRRGLR